MTGLDVPQGEHAFENRQRRWRVHAVGQARTDTADGRPKSLAMASMSASELSKLPSRRGCARAAARSRPAPLRSRAKRHTS